MLMSLLFLQRLVDTLIFMSNFVAVLECVAGSTIAGLQLKTTGLTWSGGEGTVSCRLPGVEDREQCHV